MTHDQSIGWVGGLSVASAAIAALILVWFLLKKPLPSPATHLWLLLGIGIFPIAAAAGANVSGFEAMQSRTFCGSCHVMTPHASDSNDPNSTSLAAVHARNAMFGSDNCYACHQDYGMYGFVMTKLGGVKHVYYYLTEYHSMPLEEAKHSIRIARPLPNDNCMGCHTTRAPRWLSIGDHASSLASVRAGQLSCASQGCHGFAHPITKLGKERDEAWEAARVERDKRSAAEDEIYGLQAEIRQLRGKPLKDAWAPVIANKYVKVLNALADFHNAIPAQFRGNDQ